MNPFKSGDVFYKPNVGPNLKIVPYKCHILTIVDQYYVVYKWWSKSKQYWRYQIDHWEMIKIYQEKANKL